jgi:hypothetical protein
MGTKVVKQTVFDKPFLAWHFTSSESPLLLKPNKKLVHTDELEVCKSGLHASYSLKDAAENNGYVYKNIDLLCRVKCEGEYQLKDKSCSIEKNTKFVCRERTILWQITKKDLEKIIDDIRIDLQKYLRWTDCSEIVKDYIKNGDDVILKYAYNANEENTKSNRHNHRFSGFHEFAFGFHQQKTNKYIEKLVNKSNDLIDSFFGFYGTHSGFTKEVSINSIICNIMDIWAKIMEFENLLNDEEYQKEDFKTAKKLEDLLIKQFSV